MPLLIGKGGANLMAFKAASPAVDINVASKVHPLKDVRMITLKAQGPALLAACLDDLAQRVPNLAPITDQAQGEIGLPNRARLTNPRAVDPDEVTLLAIEGDRPRLPGLGALCQVLDQRVEGCAHHSPPNTSTPAKTQAGEACPTQIT